MLLGERTLFDLALRSGDVAGLLLRKQETGAFYSTALSKEFSALQLSIGFATSRICGDYSPTSVLYNSCKLHD